jgi:hypothetical protein
MCLVGGRELPADPDVELKGAAGKPHAAPGLKHRWLGDFRQTEQLAVEPSSLTLASYGRRDLDVIDTQQHAPMMAWAYLTLPRVPASFELIPFLAVPIARAPGAAGERANSLDWRYVLCVTDEPTTQELKRTQLERERAERRRAKTVAGEDKALQHERRADKARYLADKLEERAQSERQHQK